MTHPPESLQYLTTVYPKSVLDEKRDLEIKDDKLDGDWERLTEINRQLESLGFLDSDKDPMFEAFERAMTAAEHLEELQSPVLSDSEQQRRTELAAEIVRKIRDGQIAT